jgi:hypothetical protein
VGKLLNALRLWLTKKYTERALNSSPGYRCLGCKEWSSSEEWDDNWDWSGPSCPKCGEGGMGQLANITEQEAPGIRHAGGRKGRDCGDKDISRPPAQQ